MAVLIEVLTTMGGSSSKPEVRTVEVESQESKRLRESMKLDKQLAELKDEIYALAPIIHESVKKTFSEEADALVVKYDDLADKNAAAIIRNIDQLFPAFPLKEFLVDTAQAMIHAMASTEEMSEMLRWQKRMIIKTINGKVYGMEAQYKVKLLDESSRDGYFRPTTHTKTTLLIAYKCVSHVMTIAPGDCPTDDELKSLTF